MLQPTLASTRYFFKNCSVYKSSVGENVTRKCAVSSGRCWGRRCRRSHRPDRPWAPGRKTRGSSPGVPRCCCKDPGVTDLYLTCRTTIIYQSTKLSSWGRGSPINPPRNKEKNVVENLLYNSYYKIFVSIVQNIMKYRWLIKYKQFQ